MQKITPFLWFDNNLEEAIKFYTSIFKNAQIVDLRNLGNNIITATIELEGQRFYAIQAGPQFKFTPAISFFVSCTTQEEVDHYWYKLLEGGGVEEQCGWLKDRYGLSWQIIPDALGHLMGDPDKAKAGRVMQAMLGMRKIEIAGLEAAYNG